MLAPETLKLAIMAIGGYQAEFSVYVTGLQTKEKAKSFEIMSHKIIDASKLETLEFQLYGSPKEDPQNQLESTLQLRVFAQARNVATLSAGRFLGPLMSNQLSGYPGLTANFDYRTAQPKIFCTYFPGLVKQSHVQQVVHFVSPRGRASDFEVETPQRLTLVARLPAQPSYNSTTPVSLHTFGPTAKVPLGLAVYSRSGDKGANVNVGFFFPRGRNEKEKYDWLRTYLSIERFRGKPKGPFTPFIG